jgi:hypothetical protein
MVFLEDAQNYTIRHKGAKKKANLEDWGFALFFILMENSLQFNFNEKESVSQLVKAPI